MSWNDDWVSGTTPWDQGQASAVVMRLAQRLPPRQRILVPGAGRAWEVEALADLGHHVVGLDIAPAAVEVARARIGRRADVELVVGDLFDPPDLGQFDAVAEHTCFCAVGPDLYEAYRAQVVRWLRPGGVLFGAFLDFVGGGPPFGTSPAELHAVFDRKFVVELASAETLGPAELPQIAAWMVLRS